MILIEALNISSGGGINILLALINKLNDRDIPFKVLHNAQAVLPSLGKDNSILIEHISIWRRKKTIEQAIEMYSPTSILTYNFPLPLKSDKDIFVVTDFQNLHLVDGYDASNYSLFKRLVFYVKKLYLKHYYSNSSLYITPTAFVHRKFLNTYGEHVPCRILSYFDKQTILDIKAKFVELQVEKNPNSFIYISSTSDHKNHVRLLDAWEVLYSRGYTPELKLTLALNEEGASDIIERVDVLNRLGCRIVNISADGFMDYYNVLLHTYSSSYTIYPSLNETFGFGLVEGALMDNKILVSDRDFAYQVVSPTLAFDPMNPIDIASKVMAVLEDNVEEPTSLIFEDRLDELIDILNKDAHKT